MEQLRVGFNDAPVLYCRLVLSVSLVDLSGDAIKGLDSLSRNTCVEDLRFGARVLVSDLTQGVLESALLSALVIGCFLKQELDLTLCGPVCSGWDEPLNRFLSVSMCAPLTHICR